MSNLIERYALNKLIVLAGIVLLKIITTPLIAMDSQPLTSSTNITPLSIFLGQDALLLINPSSDLIAAVEEQKILLFNKNGQYERSLDFRERIVCVAFSNDRTFIVVSLANGEVIVSDLYGTILQSYIFDEIVTALCISPDDKIVASGDWNGKIRLLSLHTRTITIAGSKKRTPLGIIRKVNPPYKHVSKVKTIAITPKNICLTWSNDTLHFWDKDGFRQKSIYFKSTAFPIVASCYHDSFSKNCFGFVDYGKLLIYNFLGKKIMQIALEHKTLSAIGINKSGSTIVGGTFDGEVFIWDAQGKLVKKLVLAASNILSIAISADNTFILIGTMHDGAFIIQNEL